MAGVVATAGEEAGKESQLAEVVKAVPVMDEVVAAGGRMAEEALTQEGVLELPGRRVCDGEPSTSNGSWGT